MLNRPHHLSADDLDLALLSPAAPPVASHLATCETCRRMVDLDRLVIDGLLQMPALAPAPDFADRVMARMAAAPPVRSARAQAARRRLVAGSLIGAGSLAASLAWAAMDPSGGVAWLGPQGQQLAESVWPTWQGLSQQAGSRPWSSLLSTAVVTPAQVMVGALVAAAVYALGLIGFRQLLTEPVPHAGR